MLDFYALTLDLYGTTLDTPFTTLDFHPVTLDMYVTTLDKAPLSSPVSSSGEKDASSSDLFKIPSLVTVISSYPLTISCSVTVISRYSYKI